MKSLLTFLSALLFSINLFASFGDSEIDKEKANVLIINSYHKGFLWTDNIVLGIEEALSKDSYELHIEYMDTKRQFDSTYQNLLANLLQYKHQKHNYQLIIISGT